MPSRIAEWLAIRSWIYYVIAGIVIALGGFGAESSAEVGGQPSIVNDYALRAFLTVGFLGGFAYWLAAGAGPEAGAAMTAARGAADERLRIRAAAGDEDDGRRARRGPKFELLPRALARFKSRSWPFRLSPLCL